MGCREQGKLERLVWVLEHHADAVEADLYGIGVDLLDYWRGDMTVRRLWVLLKHKVFQPGTATAVEIHGEAGRWTHSDNILASISDVNIKGGYPRPQDKAVLEKKRAMLARWKAKYRPEG